MYMKYVKVVFGYKDAINMDYTLSKIIVSGLKKFLESYEEDRRVGVVGVPGDFATITDDGHDVTDSDVDNWIDTINKMIYAFEDKEPDITDYNFKLTFGSLRRVDNEDEYERFKQDQGEHSAKVKEGLELFAKYFQNLWL